MDSYSRKISGLVDAIRQNGIGDGPMQFDDMDEACGFISDRLDRFPAYVNSVVRMQTNMNIWTAQYLGEPEKFQYHVKQADTGRRLAHDSAIDSINQLNRLCEKHGLDKFMDVDTSDRHACAEAIGDYVSAMYLEGIGGQQPEKGRSFDRAVDAVEGAKAPLPEKGSYQRMMAMLARQDGSGTVTTPQQETPAP
ncbi:MAG: DUF3232 domain-containing protein [Muribaculaceae bacterium]|nr:DUF3232 domain-containing protein [Muribaculaceae bacterium]